MRNSDDRFLHKLFRVIFPTRVRAYADIRNAAKQLGLPMGDRVDEDHRDGYLFNHCSSVCFYVSATHNMVFPPMSHVKCEAVWWGDTIEYGTHRPVSAVLLKLAVLARLPDLSFLPKTVTGFWPLAVFDADEKPALKRHAEALSSEIQSYFLSPPLQSVHPPVTHLLITGDHAHLGAVVQVSTVGFPSLTVCLASR